MHLCVRVLSSCTLDITVFVVVFAELIVFQVRLVVEMDFIPFKSVSQAVLSLSCPGFGSFTPACLFLLLLYYSFPLFLLTFTFTQFALTHSMSQLSFR